MPALNLPRPAAFHRTGCDGAINGFYRKLIYYSRRRILRE